MRGGARSGSLRERQRIRAPGAARIGPGNRVLAGPGWRTSALPAGVPKIEVTFDIDANGILDTS
jgi:hypothetical protein